jgi:hypothetical protein
MKYPASKRGVFAPSGKNSFSKAASSPQQAAGNSQQRIKQLIIKAE